MSAYKLKRRAERVAAGKCKYAACGRELHTRTLCEGHATLLRVQIARLRRERVESGMCIDCGVVPYPDESHRCIVCGDRNRKLGREAYAASKIL